tara:strand:+ start:1327 stop:2382 length:1056 start_codon:yes stop_codon:yes gene_type:complete
MKAKHKTIKSHKDLYDSIYNEIKESINFDKKKESRYFLFKGAFYLSLLLFSYTSLYFITNPVLYVMDFVLLGYSIVFLCFNFAHDLSHHAIFKNARVNNFLFECIYTIVGAHPEAWKKRHTKSHHFAPNVENFDTDLSITDIIRVLPQSPKKWYHKYQYLYAPIAYTTYTIYWALLKDFISLKKFSPEHGIKQKVAYYLRFVFCKVFYFAYLIVFPIIFSEQNVQLVVIGFITMHLIQSLYILFTFFITHHVEKANYPTADNFGVINTSWFMNQIKSSNDFYPFSNIANFIFGGVNNHIAHHLYPHINHYYYPKVNKILFGRLRESGIEPNVSTYFGGIRSHLKHLKNMGQ